MFVHGFGTDQRAWKDVADAFLADFRVVLLDNAGAGGSDPVAFDRHQDRYLSLDGYAADLLDVCEALELDGATFVGHSAGAMACVLAALRQPARASRLVLIGASPRYVDAPGYRGGFTRAEVDGLYADVMGRFSDWARAFAPAMMGNPDRPALAAQFADAIQSIPKDRVLTVLYSIFRSDYREVVARLSLPVLLIQSSEDPAVPIEVAEFMHRSIANSRLVVIRASGHLPHVSSPGKVVEAMRDFVTAP